MLHVTSFMNSSESTFMRTFFNMEHSHYSSSSKHPTKKLKTSESARRKMKETKMLLNSFLHSNEKYKNRYIHLRKLLKEMVFENAALCDEVAQIQERILRAKEERRFLLKKLCQYQNVSELAPVDSSAKNTAAPTPSITNIGTSACNTDNNELKTKKKVTVKKKITKDLLESLKTKSKRKKSTSTTKRLVQPISLDATGRPIFPIALGGLTVHSLGEVVSDRPGFHSEEFIFPVGFCSTRVYASRINPEQRCLYTCKITDNGTDPKFEIVPDDDHEHPIVGASASECHQLLLQAINSTRNDQAVVDPTVNLGPEFFGFSHSTIQNLIQSCPGARKCASYKWIKFEVVKSESCESGSPNENDSSLSFETLQKNISAAAIMAANMPEGIFIKQEKPSFHEEYSTSLRSLLTASNIRIIGS